jgi:hypothetical protein
MDNHTDFEPFAMPFQELFMLCFVSGFTESGTGSKHFAESGSGYGSRLSLNPDQVQIRIQPKVLYDKKNIMDTCFDKKVLYVVFSPYERMFRLQDKLQH